MADLYGMQVWDASGNLILDFSDRISSVVYAGIASAAGSITSDGFSRGSLFFATIAYSTTTNTQPFTLRPQISQSGTTVSWTLPVSGSVLLILGTY